MNANEFKVALVGLDLTSMDDSIISYLPTLFNVLPLEHVIFVHVARKLELPQALLEKYPNLVAPLDEGIANDITKKVAPIFEKRITTFDVIVEEGTPLEGFLKAQKIKQADLIVMGRKKSLEGSGILSGHVVRKSPVSMLFIPQNPPQLSSILAPVDYSEHSALAANLAIQMKQNSSVKLFMAHVYSVPVGYYKTGKSYKEFAHIMKVHADKDLELFREENNIDKSYECEQLLAENMSVPQLINDYAHRTNTSLIVIGSRGRTKTSALLIGSIVEKLVFKDADIPVFVVKRKGESMGFMETLMHV